MKINNFTKISLIFLVIVFSLKKGFSQQDTFLDYHLKVIDKFPVFMNYCDSNINSSFIEYCFSMEVDSIIDFKAAQGEEELMLLIIKPGVKWEYNIIEIWYWDELVGDSELSFKMSKLNHSYVTTNNGVYPIISEFDWLYSNFKVALIQIKPNYIKVSLNGSLYKENE